MQKRNGVHLVVGAGQLSLAIVRRVARGEHILVGDKSEASAAAFSKVLKEAGFSVETMRMDLGEREDIAAFVERGLSLGPIQTLINGAGVSPSQASIETILRVDLYGVAALLEAVGAVIAKGGCGLTISSQSGHRMPALSPEQDWLLATTPAQQLLSLPMLAPSALRDTLHAYQMAKRCNELRVMAEAIRWGRRGARINAVAPGIIVTPLALDEFAGERGAFYREMFARAPAARPGTADEVVDVAELLLSSKAAFITGSTYLIDGGATADYLFGKAFENW